MVTIVGKEHVKYFSKKNQRDVDGYKIYTLEADKNVAGFKTDSFFVPRELYEEHFDLPLDTEVEVYYNRYGTPAGCTVCRKEN